MVWKSPPRKTCKGLQGAEPVQRTVANQWFATGQVKDHKGFYSLGFFLNTWTLLTLCRDPPSFSPLFFFFFSTCSISSLNSAAYSLTSVCLPLHGRSLPPPLPGVSPGSLWYCAGLAPSCLSPYLGVSDIGALRFESNRRLFTRTRLTTCRLSFRGTLSPSCRSAMGARRS